MDHSKVITVHHSDDSPVFLSQFNALMLETFGISFETWQRKGGWNDDYICCSILHAGEMLSNVSLFRMKMLVYGQERPMLQLGAVATRHGSRGRGLSKAIFDFIFDEFPNTPIFLCAHESAEEFYTRLGFLRIHDRQPLVRVELESSKNGVRRLSAEDPVVMRYLHGRGCFSAILDCTNAAPINLFHLLQGYPDCIYEIPDLQTLLVAKQHGDTLTLLDVVSYNPVTFEVLCDYLPFSGVKLIRFGFNPDWLNLGFEWEAFDQDLIFVRRDTGFRENFILPLLLRT